MPDELMPDELVPHELMPAELVPAELVPAELMPDERLFHGPRPPMAMHWPAPPGGWHPDDGTAPVLTDGGASTKSGLGAGPVETQPAGTQPAETQPAETWLSEPIASAPPPPPRSRLPVIVSVVAGVLVLALMAGVAVATVVGVRRYRQDHRQTTVAMRQPVRDGAFRFTADEMQCGLHEIGPPDDYQSPTGQFCVITLTIKNVGTAPAIFADAIQKAYGADGVWFGSDSEAAFYANPDPDIFFNDINPGNTVRALVVYDIPPAGHILRLEVHENPTTRGAVIKLG
jgi:Domain of unknown function (DUF4352)